MGFGISKGFGSFGDITSGKGGSGAGGLLGGGFTNPTKFFSSIAETLGFSGDKEKGTEAPPVPDLVKAGEVDEAAIEAARKEEASRIKGRRGRASTIQPRPLGLLQTKTETVGGLLRG